MRFSWLDSRDRVVRKQGEDVTQPLNLSARLRDSAGQAPHKRSAPLRLLCVLRVKMPPGFPTRALTCIALFFTLLVGLAVAQAHQGQSTSELTVHEWGTFTSIAARDGQVFDWLPLTGSTDLPPFVEHLRDVNFKGGLHGTVRMETPVLYFYSPREATVSVNVSLDKGLITEWYPSASASPSVDPLLGISLDEKETEGQIIWNSVHIEPAAAADFPTGTSGNHYYAARETSSAPLRVQTASGDQRERFLFYRGVSVFTLPVSAKISPGGAIQIENLSPQQIPRLILFERRGSKSGYRIVGPLQNQTTLLSPELSPSSNALFSDLEGILVSQGLFPDEAHAMLQTWKNSWFEEGSRLFYIVPREFVDSVVPLSIAPTPTQTVRVFVGRIELITPATEHAVEAAFASGDRTALAKYARFLEPILQIMIQNSRDPVHQRKLGEYLVSVYNNPPAQPVIKSVR